MPHQTWRTGDAARRAGAALAVAGASLVVLSSQAALAASDRANDRAKPPPPIANSGTVKVHKPGTRAADRRDEPKVCRFSLAAFDFGAAQQVAWVIRPLSGSDGKVVARSTITLDANGHGASAVPRLRDGHYKLSFAAIGTAASRRDDEHGRHDEDENEGDDEGNAKDEDQDQDDEGEGRARRGKGHDRVSVSIAKHKVFKVDCTNGGKGDADKDNKSDNAQGNGNQAQATPPATGSNPPAQPGGQGDREGAGGALPITGRTIAGISGTAGALILTGIIAIILMRRRGIGPFNTHTAAHAAATSGGAPSGADASGDRAPGGAASGGTPPTGLFGPLLGPAAPPNNPPTTQGPQGPPASPSGGPIGPPRPST